MKLLATYLFLAAIGSYLTSTSADYCKIKTCENKPHTMCTYTSTQPSNQCGKVESTVLSNEDVQNILNMHNIYRRKVASGHESKGLDGGQPAGIIPDLTWDDELANIATKWAMQCLFYHDQCRDTEKEQVGQNIGMIYNANSYYGTWTNIVTNWYNEDKQFDNDEVKKFVFKTSIGHYSQLVWGNTKRVGCGGIKYIINDWYYLYLVCNYGPAGNWAGQPVYKTF